MMETINTELIMESIRDSIEKSGMSIGQRYLANDYYEKTMRDIKKHDQYVIVGSGVYGQMLMRMMEAEEISDRILCICDNSKERQEIKLNEKDVYPVEIAARRFPNAYFIITPRKHEIDIIRQLINLGISPNGFTMFMCAYTGLEY